MVDLTILLRCSDDLRFERCLDSIDVACPVIAALTPNPTLEAIARRRRVPYALSPRGNPAATTLSALPLCPTSRVLLVDSDCVFLPGAIVRMAALAQTAAIVRPTVQFAHVDMSSYATAIARDFQYTYCGFVYEPGLLVDLDQVLPQVGNMLFSPYAPFTPDGELDYRVRQCVLPIATDPQPTLVHDVLSFAGHLRSYWRYGGSEICRMQHLKQPVLTDYLQGVPARYRSALSKAYPIGTTSVIAISDTFYLLSMLYHVFRPLQLPQQPDLEAE